MKQPDKTLCSCFKKLKIKLPNDPAISLLKIYLKKAEILTRKCICTPMFIAMLFFIFNFIIIFYFLYILYFIMYVCQRERGIERYNLEFHVK